MNRAILGNSGIVSAESTLRINLFRGAGIYVVPESPAEPPTDLSLSSNSVDENQSAGTVVGIFSTADPDSSSFTYSLVAGTGDTDNANFQINGADLETAATLDYETQTTHNIRVRTEDPDGNTYEEAFTISVNDISESVLLEDCEVGDLSNYSGDAGSFAVDSSRAYNGTYALRFASSTLVSDVIYRTDLSAQQSDTLTFWVWTPATPVEVLEEALLCFGFQDADNYYYAGFRSTDGTNRYLTLDKRSAGSDSNLDAAQVSTSAAWHQVTVDWGTNGDIAVSWDGGSETATGTDTDYASGGIGWRGDSGAAPASYQCYADYLESI